MKLILRRFVERTLEDSIGRLLTFYFHTPDDHQYMAKFIDTDLAICDINRWYNLACCFVTASKSNQDVWVDIPDQDPMSHCIAWSTGFTIDIVDRPHSFLPIQGKSDREIYRKDQQG